MFAGWVVWLVMGLAVLALELIGVFNRRPGDTISEQVWWLLRRGFAFALLPFYLWLGWHFFVEFWLFPQLRWSNTDDLWLISTAAVLTAAVEWLLRRRRARGARR